MEAFLVGLFGKTIAGWVCSALDIFSCAKSGFSLFKLIGKLFSKKKKPLYTTGQKFLLSIIGLVLLILFFC